uniref:Uncharacterized protein n=1 Tax=Rhodopseudomonas palustris (strain DX-1) TaxID=652103 RepID=E6VBP6_RHOPX
MVGPKFPIDWNRVLDVLFALLSVARELIEILKLWLGA